MSRKKRNQPSLPSAGYWPQTSNAKPYKRPEQGYRPSRRSGSPRKNKLLFIGVFFVLSVLFVYSAVQLTIYLVQSHQAKQEERMIQEMIVQSEALAAPSSPPDTEPTPAAQPSPTVAQALQYRAPSPSVKPDILLQFANALSVNPDTVGQLQMGESIKTYVVQRDNSYYLRHSFSGEYSFSGAIFLDVSCSIAPQSRNLIVHGHNMQDGTAFGKLSRFDDLDYLNQYPFIRFSTLYESARYVPFASVYYSIDPKSNRYLDIYGINSMSDEVFIQFISKVQLMSEYLLPVYVAASDHILTVTTCAGDEDVDRFAVFAVKRDSI